GVVTRCDMVEGEVVNSSQPQYTVADLQTMWITLDVRPEDISRVQKGQRITFRPDGLGNSEAGGTVSWLSSEVDEKTRTVAIRAEVDNPSGQLRARSFGAGRILVGEKSAGLAVPHEAVQWDSGSLLVFVRKDDELTFQSRKVRPGIRDQDYVEILEGLQAG